MITELAPAKINLALHVRARRPDGYHQIETLFAFCRDGDSVKVEKAQANAFAMTGPFAQALSGEQNNLAVVAATAFRSSFSIRGSQSIVLDKHLPIASGIGGGSADAAAVLRALARMFGKPLDGEVMQLCAASTGSDVPACLLGQTAIGHGRGDELEPIGGLTNTPVLLVNPGVAVSTAEVFAAWNGHDHGPLPSKTAREIAMAGRNDLEAPAIALCPVIAEVLAALRGTNAWLTRMSGSGATCFALFDSEAARAAAHAMISAAHPGWWCLESTLV